MANRVKWGCGVLVVFLHLLFIYPLYSFGMTTDSTEWQIPKEHLVTKDSIIEKKFVDALVQTMEGNYTGAESTYRNIINTTEEKSLQAKALYELGGLYQHHLEDLLKAQEIYQEILDYYPETNLVESSQFQLGVVYYHQKKFNESYSVLSTYIAKFPDGKYRDNAKFMSTEAATILGISLPKPKSIRLAGEFPKLEGYTVRIAIHDNVNQISVTSEDEYAIWTGETIRQIKLAKSENDTKIRLNNNIWEIGQTKVTTDRLLIVPQNGAPIKLNDKPYRGQFQLVKSDNSLTVVNIITLEEYLYSVVPKEVPHSWPMEALKAQAIAARTYALSRIATRSNHQFDMVATEGDQMYGGYLGERDRTTQAVDETRGQILTYDGEPILSYFHSNSGGTVEDSLSVFGMKRPYLRRLDDPHSRNTPGYQWRLVITSSEMERRLKSKGISVGSIQNIIISDTSPSGRTKKIKIMHSKGTLVLTATDFRWKIDSHMLRSTLFTIRKQGNSYVFNGKGYGHGVGLSQWGSYSMARKGKSFRDILAFYYPGTHLNYL